MRIKITESRWIGDESPVFIIAEVGNNHQGRMDLALSAIDHAARAGADAVSFQYAPLHTYCTRDLYEHPNLAFLRECEFSIAQLSELAAKVHSCGMAFSINVEDAETLDLALDIGIDFIKLCSADLTNIPYIRHCAGKKRPIFFSTGAAFLGEIELAFHAMRDAGLSDYVIYHTNSAYPTPIDEANILQMDVLHEIFGGVKGYCDHTVEIIPPIVAVARGAKVIEKHITTSRALRGDDWMVSLEPDEFKTMVAYIRQAEHSLGTREKAPMPSEQGTRLFKRKSIVSKKLIPKGTVLENDLFCFKLPGTGISPVDLASLLGRRVRQDIPPDVVIERSMLEDPS
ncbi:MAG: N-acetylneuraminate synthase family protein [Alphaproteobacteria bacterium]|nr:N-acetylneuraminate synthase family protein [Alphaproteobacteria bacterium]